MKESFEEVQKKMIKADKIPPKKKNNYANYSLGLFIAFFVFVFTRNYLGILGTTTAVVIAFATPLVAYKGLKESEKLNGSGKTQSKLVLIPSAILAIFYLLIFIWGATS